MTDEKEQTFRERQRQNKLPLQYALYKGVKGSFGAMRLSLKKAYTDERRDRDDGCVFVEMAPATGPNNYDWENSKIVMALSIVDIPKIILYLRSPAHPSFTKTEGKLKLYHDKGAGTADRGNDTTSLNIEKPVDKDSFFFSAFQKKGTVSKQASLPVSQDEALCIATLLQAAIPLIVAWN